MCMRVQSVSNAASACMAEDRVMPLYVDASTRLAHLHVSLSESQCRQMRALHLIYSYF